MEVAPRYMLLTLLKWFTLSNCKTLFTLMWLKLPIWVIWLMGLRGLTGLMGLTGLK